jgi:hypothetical protein
MRSVFLNLLIVIAAPAATLDRVAVVVGNHVFTEGEVMDELRLEEFTSSQPLDLSPALLREAADRMVDQQLIRNEMEIASYPQPEPASADEMLRNFSKQRFHSQAEFQAALVKYGVTEQQLKDYLLWQLATLRFTDERFRPNVPALPDQAAAPPAQSAPPPAPTAPPPAVAPPAQLAPKAALPFANPGAQQPAGNQEANRADTSANRAAAADADVDVQGVDNRLDAWLKQVRAATKVVIKKEAFQ